MTANCIKELEELREIELFSDLSLEQLLYECLRANNWDGEELKLIIDDLVKHRKVE